MPSLHKSGNEGQIIENEGYIGGVSDHVSNRPHQAWLCVPHSSAFGLSIVLWMMG